MKLNTKERLMFSRLLPMKGNLLELLMARNIAKRMEVTKEEKSKIKMVRTPKGWQWDSEKEVQKDFAFSKEELKLLKVQVARIDGRKEVTPDLLDLCIKIRDYEQKK